MKALLAAKQKEDPRGWQAFQKQVSTLRLQSTRTCRELEDALSALDSSASMASLMPADASAGAPVRVQDLLACLHIAR